MSFTSSLIKILLIMAVLFAFILPGYLLSKKKLVGEECLISLSNILIYACQPLLTIKAFAVAPVAPSQTVLLNIVWVLFLTLISMLVMFGLSRLTFIGLKEKKRKDVYSFVAVFSNCGFIGIPFLDIMTGGNSEALMYVAVYNVIFNVLVWTLGVYLMTQNLKDISLRHAFLNPSMIGCYVGFLLFLIPQINIFNMEEVKELQQIPVYFSAMTSVLSMFIVGVRMAYIPFRSLFTDLWGYVACCLRLIVSPLMMIGIVLFIDSFLYPFHNGYVWLAAVVASAMSPATSVVAYSEKFGGDKYTATRTFIQGTILSVITIPVIIAWLSTVF